MDISSPKKALGISIGHSYAHLLVKSMNPDIIDIDKFITVPMIVELKGKSFKLADFFQIVGRKYSDPTAKEYIDKLPYSFEEGPNGEPLLVFKHESEKISYRIEYLFELIFHKLKSQIVNTKLDQLETGISIPPSLGDDQRVAIRNAAKTAGFQVFRVYDHHRSSSFVSKFENQNDTFYFISINMGTTTTSISKLECEEGIVDLISTYNHSFGGKDFANRLMDNYTLKQDEYETDKRQALENAIINLSKETQHNIEINDQQKILLSRGEMEKICELEFQRYEQLLRAFLKENKTSIKDIKHVLISGGCMNMPKLQQITQQVFPNSILHNENDCLMVTSLGLAQLIARKNSAPPPLIHIEVHPLSIGYDLGDGLFRPVLRKGEIYHFPKTHHILLGSAEIQDSSILKIYEGERPLSEQNNVIGDFPLNWIPRNPHRILELGITFHTDPHCILHIKGLDISTQESYTKQLVPKERLSYAQIQEMLKTNEEMKSSDEKHVQCIEFRTIFHMKCLRLKKVLQDSVKGGEINDEKRQNLTLSLEKCIEWYSEYIKKDFDPSELDKKAKEIEELFINKLGDLYTKYLVPLQYNLFSTMDSCYAKPNVKVDDLD